MGRSVPHNLKSTHQTEFVKIFNSLCGCAAHRAITDECKHCGNYRAEIERRRMLPLPEKGEHHEPET